MSALLTGKAFETKVGSSQAERNAKQVLTLLANYADENDRAWPSVDTLADKLECSPSAIKRALGILKDKGLIKRDYDYGTRYGADRSPYVYHITLDDAEKVTKQRRRAKAKAKEREKAREKRGFTHDTPQGITDEPPRGSTHEHDGGSHMTPRGGSHVNERGSTHEPQTFIEHSTQHPRESTRVQNPKPKTTNERSSEQRRQALADYRPTPDLTALAESYGLDPEWELGKFRDTCLAEGKIPHDPASAYRKWLKRGRELNIGKPAAPPAANDAGNPDTELERRARKLLATSTPLRQRQPDDRERLRWLPQVAGLLAQGTSPARVVGLVCEAFDRGELDEAA
ncbi:helix-turn-helix domain-containing protein [Bifidobacterium scardovii]|mgnify:CR=1 FL=1|uniref:DNA-binding helix-turn-helix protein n=1 Tax=Bifidobacterium scardovii TaxID=158787 RepID=A0A087D430_9BIFI|nr:helix-turn-helix domain-containing protein [Bifidobacterium scardovii]KFI90280.1 DNA-binding helix-turn-helix protein [Bifidobacterium scardovii]MDK6350035.1 helix-turn-helix domain-containing protein [Bifidobacterium scardovii]MDU8982156.1 helix-turn-helix domain-containing protein [Bifidobacterium scardovii]BAQ30485.1 hypothetical protein BBSC_0405 [Bifidobacterium scardovii JCM 12489 = DSM 13734]